MTGKIAERFSKYGSLLKERVRNKCPYKEHFCNGDPVVPGTGKKAKKACPYFDGNLCQNMKVCIRGIEERESE